MNDYIDTAELGFDDRFAVGQPVPRSEDPVLLRGEGHYSDDINLPGQAYCVMVRSQQAHGVIRVIDTKSTRRNGKAMSTISAPSPASTASERS